jgi:16S rRNA processing protein RimM
LKPDPADLYAVGRIVKVFGIGGEIVVIPMTDAPGRFKSSTRLYIGNTPGVVGEYRVERSSVRPQGARLKLAGVNDRTQAQTLVGSLLFVRGSDLKRPSPGAFFIHDVIGLTVIDQDGVAVGTVRDVIRQANHDIYAVESGGREILIPAVKEFIKKIDLDQKTMRVVLIEGMA